MRVQLVHVPDPAPPRAPEDIRLALLTRGPVLQAYVRSLPDNEEHLIPMRRDAAGAATPPGWQRWHARLPWDGGNALTRWAFKAVGADGQRWLAADGEHAHVPPEGLHFVAHRHARPPGWARAQVVYQVFPDRFARGLPPVDRTGETLPGSPPRPVVQPPWGAPVDPAHAANAFYGGDLVGIARRLPWLHEELGATALYLNPVFDAGSNHRYDTRDHTRVDPHLGGDAALAALSAALHARGMRLVLDGVVNHTGDDHPWFNRWGTHAGVLGAAQSPASPTRGFYVFDDDGPGGHAWGWKGHASLPVLDFSHPGVQQAIYAGPDALLRRWLRPPYAIDGWRLDVVHMLGEGRGAWRNLAHVQAMREAIRAESPEALVIGEHFAEATRWLQGEPEDGAMNYHGFALPLRAWLAGRDNAGHPVQLSTAGLARWLLRALGAVPWANALAQWNLLDSHDTPRFLTWLGGDRQRLMAALTLLFTWPGVPCLYYGTEIGLEGGPDPDCRRCMDWERAHWDLELFEHCAALARLRRTRREWQEGAVVPLRGDSASGDGAGAPGSDALPGVHGEAFAYARLLGDAATLVVVNRGGATRVLLDLDALPLQPARWLDEDGRGLVPQGSRLALDVPAGGSRCVRSS